MDVRTRSLSLAVALACTSCGGGDDAPTAPDADDGGFDRRAMLQHLGDHFFVPTHAAFATQAAALRDATGAYCTALASGDAATERDAARAAWRAAMDGWERADEVLVGPAALDMKALRDRIYAWPLAATCGVDREVPVAFADPGAYDVTAELANVRSLAAVEYLLFNEATAHTCAATPTGWDELGADLPRARCALAALLAADVAVAGDLVADAWPAYVSELTEAGTSASSIVSLREAVNRVSDALFYVDKMVKDMKLGEAAGITINACGTVEEPCEREVEHRWADHATAALRVNLRAFRDVFTGTIGAGADVVDGPSFEDHLRALGATDLADRMVASIDAAIALADGLPDSFLGVLGADRDAVVALHAAVKALTDDLKSQFLTVLGLEIPDDVAADND